MLAALVGVQVAAGLLLRGAWDVWAQSVVLLFLAAGLGAWLAGGALRGRLRLPSPRPTAWVAVLALLSFLSARLSPVAAYALPAWAAFAAGLWLIPAATLLDADDRARVEQAVRAAAWVLFLLAVYQRLHGEPRPPASLLDKNVFSGAVLLLLPIAVRREDGILAVGLLLCLWWTRSVGAWLGLSVAVLLHRRLVGPIAFWAGAAVGFAGLVAVYAKIESPATLYRWAWWGAAWRMAAGAPWLGLGPGSFDHALPAYISVRPELLSLGAHQHLLETAAERGWPYLVLWCGGLTALLIRARPAQRFGLVAALVQGLIDSSLSVPGVFWLFCLSAAWVLPESERSVAVRGGRKLSAAAAALAAAALAGVWVERNWRADRLRAAAVDQLVSREERGLSAAESELAASEELRPHPEAARLRAEIAMSRAARGNDPPRRLREAAAQLERAVSLDPYRTSSWRMLDAVYRRLGRGEDAAGARERGARACPSLRAEPS